MAYQKIISLHTGKRGMINITHEISDIVTSSTIETGLCNIFLHHTSASLILCENADPDVQRDMQEFMHRLVPDGDKLFKHTLEGPDDMSAHIKSVLTHNSLTIPVTNNSLGLGTWQGIFLWEHRIQGHIRKLTVTVS